MHSGVVRKYEDRGLEYSQIVFDRVVNMYEPRDRNRELQNIFLNTKNSDQSENRLKYNQILFIFNNIT